MTRKGRAVNLDGTVKSQLPCLFVIPAKAGHEVKHKRSSSEFKYFWMPVADPVSSGDQVRHDDWKTFHGSINLNAMRHRRRGSETPDERHGSFMWEE